MGEMGLVAEGVELVNPVMVGLMGGMGNVLMGGKGQGRTFHNITLATLN